MLVPVLNIPVQPDTPPPFSPLSLFDSDIDHDQHISQDSNSDEMSEQVCQTRIKHTFTLIRYFRLNWMSLKIHNKVKREPPTPAGIDTNLLGTTSIRV